MTVGDALGLSYYGDKAVESYLPLDTRALLRARRELVQVGLIAYERPFYQVLSLLECSKTPERVERQRGGELSSVADIMRRALEAK